MADFYCRKTPSPAALLDPALWKGPKRSVRPAAAHLRPNSWLRGRGGWCGTAGFPLRSHPFARSGNWFRLGAVCHGSDCAGRKERGGGRARFAKCC